jgi:hypothetical protein
LSPFLTGLTLSAVSVPTVSLLALAPFLLSDGLGLKRSARRAHTHIELAITAGRLVHELQRERGLSVARANGGDAGGLEAQRISADSAASAYQTAAHACPTAGIGKALALAEDNAGHCLNHLNDLRRGVEGGGVAVPDVVAGYSAVIRALLDLSAAIIREFARGAMARPGLAYVNLMLAKEWAGQERAAVTGALSSRRMDDTARMHIRELVANQTLYLDLFRGFAGSDLAARLDRAVADSEAEVASLRVRLLAANDAPLPDADDWFAAATRRIEALKTAEGMVADALLGGSAASERRIARQPWTLGGLSAASAASIAGMAMLAHSLL